jgi:hypothetical protein
LLSLLAILGMLVGGGASLLWWLWCGVHVVW